VEGSGAGTQAGAVSEGKAVCVVMSSPVGIVGGCCRIEERRGWRGARQDLEVLLRLARYRLARHEAPEAKAEQDARCESDEDEKAARARACHDRRGADRAERCTNRIDKDQLRARRYPLGGSQSIIGVRHAERIKCEAEPAEG